MELVNCQNSKGTACYALTGNTKSYKELIKKCGGSWNTTLDIGQGWVFWNRNVDQAKAIAEAANAGHNQEEIAESWGLTLELPAYYKPVNNNNINNTPMSANDAMNLLTNKFNQIPNNLKEPVKMPAKVVLPKPLNKLVSDIKNVVELHQITDEKHTYQVFVTTCVLPKVNDKVKIGEEEWLITNIVNNYTVELVLNDYVKLGAVIGGTWKTVPELVDIIF